MSAEPDLPRRVQPLGDDVAAVAFVQAAAVCRELPEEQLAEIYGSGEVVEYGPGQLIVVEGATDSSLYFIVEGSLTVCKQRGDALVELAALERPAIFGEAAALTGQPRSASVVTQTDVRLIRIPGELVRRIADAAPKFGRLLATLMAARQKETEKRLG